MKKFLVLMCVLSLFLAVPVYSASITETGMSQGDLVKLLKSLKATVLSGAISSASLTAPNYASNGATASTQSVFTYRVNGRFYTSFAASTNLYVTKVGIAQPVSTYCYYLFTINSSGVVTVTKGRHAASTAGAAYPAAPSGGAIFGGVLIKTSAATAFTMGTSPFTPTYLPGGYPIWYQISSVYNEPGFAVLP
jgi:hypothetical protein